MSETGNVGLRVAEMVVAAMAGDEARMLALIDALPGSMLRPALTLMVSTEADRIRALAPENASDQVAGAEQSLVNAIRADEGPGAQRSVSPKEN